MHYDALDQRIGKPCEKVGIVVDGPFLYHACKALDLDLSFRRLLSVVAGDAELVEAVYATTMIVPDIQSRLHALLEVVGSLGYRIVVRPVRAVDGPGNRRRIIGSISVDVALEALDLAEKVDHLVLFAGSRDYVPLLRRFRGHRVRLTLVSTPLLKLDHFDGEILTETDAFVDLRDLQSRVRRFSAAASAKAAT
jgi:uncharacterized LabA/DUF88 family protein